MIQDATDDWAVFAMPSVPQECKKRTTMMEHFGLKIPNQPPPAIERKDTNACIECNEQMVICREGLTCVNCGWTETNLISEQAEWTSGPSSNGEAPKQSSRVGAPSNNNGLFSNQLGTMVKSKYPGYRNSEVDRPESRSPATIRL